MTIAVSNGRALRYAPPSLRHDRTVVIVALANNGSELRHASATLPSDKRIILRAASNDSVGDALHFVSNKDELLTDMGFVANLIRCYKCPRFYSEAQYCASATSSPGVPTPRYIP